MIRESFELVDDTFMYDSSDRTSGLDTSYIDTGIPYEAGSKGVSGYKVPYMALYGFNGDSSAVRGALKSGSGIEADSLKEFWKDTKSAITKFNTLKKLQAWALVSVGSSSALADEFLTKLPTDKPKFKAGIVKTGTGNIHDPLNKISQKTVDAYNNALKKGKISAIQPMHRSFVRGWFKLTDNFVEFLQNLEYPNITIVDDVKTSGFTLADASRLIMEARPDAEVSALFLLSSEGKPVGKKRIMKGRKEDDYGKVKLERYTRLT